MKKTLLMLTSLSLLLSLPAWADHHLVFIHNAVKLNSTACAVNLKISAPDQNGFEGSDRVTLNGNLLASLGDDVAAAINAGGHVNTGDSILFASQAFQDGIDIVADVSFPNSSCAGFKSDSEFAFVLDDLAFGGANTVIDTLQAKSPFGNENTAIEKSSAGSETEVIDLVNDTVEVANNTDTFSSVGEEGLSTGGDAGDDPALDNSGCSLIR